MIYYLHFSVTQMAPTVILVPSSSVFHKTMVRNSLCLRRPNYAKKRLREASKANRRDLPGSSKRSGRFGNTAMLLVAFPLLVLSVWRRQRISFEPNTINVENAGPWIERAVLHSLTEILRPASNIMDFVNCLIRNPKKYYIQCDWALPPAAISMPGKTCQKSSLLLKKREKFKKSKEPLCTISKMIKAPVDQNPFHLWKLDGRKILQEHLQFKWCPPPSNDNDTDCAT